MATDKPNPIKMSQYPNNAFDNVPTSHQRLLSPNAIKQNTTITQTGFLNSSGLTIVRNRFAAQ